MAFHRMVYPEGPTGIATSSATATMTGAIQANIVHNATIGATTIPAFGAAIGAIGKIRMTGGREAGGLTKELRRV